MRFLRVKTLLVILGLCLSIPLSGCGINRSDVAAVAEAFFRATLAKDYNQLQLLLESGSAPSRDAWAQGLFFVDRTQDKFVQRLWTTGSVGAYTINQITFEDDISAKPDPALKKLAHVTFMLSGKRLVASFTMRLSGRDWYPFSNPTHVFSANISDDILLWFDEA